MAKIKLEIGERWRGHEIFFVCQKFRDVNWGKKNLLVKLVKISGLTNKN
jgi:hypothetical protein